jgi:hypothetical protein
MTENKAIVISLLHAQVLAMGIQKSGYGRSALFADLNNKGIYMVAHLFDFIDLKIDQIVSPGESVALTGGSGWNNKTSSLDEGMYESHLHVSYFDVQYDNKESTNYVTQDGDFFTRLDDLRYGSEKDPFNHLNGYDKVIYSQ